MSFQRIPIEILLQILNDLGPIDLFHFACVSHHIYAVVEPILYHSINIITNSPAHPTVSRLLLTFLVPGDVLATHVRRLAWSTGYLRESEDDSSSDENAAPEDNLVEAELVPQLTEESQPSIPGSLEVNIPIESTDPALSDIALFKAAASGFGIDDSLQSTSAQFLLLLHLLPGLQVLQIALPNDPGPLDDFVAGLTALQPLATLPIGLQSLRYFYCCTSMANVRGVVPELLMTIMGLPHIETILVQLIEGDYQQATAEAFVSTSRVENLCFMWAPVAPSLLNAMLKIPVALKSFCYSIQVTTRTDLRAMGIAQMPVIDLREIGVALQPHRTTLECLQIEITIIDGGDGGTRIAIESLRDWPALVMVRCSLSTLLGKGPQTVRPILLVDVLPACLQELEIILDRTSSVEEVVGAVIPMLGQKQNMLPDLSRLVVMLGTEKSPELLAGLWYACLAAGVELIEDESYLMVDCFTNVSHGGDSAWP